MDVKDPGTTLWTLAKDGGDLSCVARLVPYGVEIDILRDNHLIVTRTFESDDEALAWANTRRASREAAGWALKEPKTS